MLIVGGGGQQGDVNCRCVVMVMLIVGVGGQGDVNCRCRWSG